MFRLNELAAMLAMLPVVASAVEMQTNFHYGEHVGFPSMEVPTSIYGGWGTRGWNCNAMGKVPLQSGLPAMYPTGCNPHVAGCNYCDGVWAGYQQKAFHKRVNTRWYYGNHRPMPPGGAMPGDGMPSNAMPGEAMSGDAMEGIPYQGAPVTIEGGVPTVVHPQQTPSQLTPTPASSGDSRPADDHPVPRTTSRPYKSAIRPGTAG